MANYNLAFGGDSHYNENYSLYPQNAYIEGRPEFGNSDSILKPDEHWQGGHFAAVRHMSFNDEARQCALKEVAQGFAVGDTFLSHIIPAGSMFTDFSYRIYTPLAGATFTVKLAKSGTVLGTVDGSTAGDGWIRVGTNGAGVYVPYSTNEAVEWVIDAWPDPEEPVGTPDPCGIYPACCTPLDFCFTSTAFYKNARAEAWCDKPCWGQAPVPAGEGGQA